MQEPVMTFRLLSRTDNETHYVSTDSLLPYVSVLKGTKQRCPLNELLFNIVFHCILRPIQAAIGWDVVLTHEDVLLLAVIPEIQTRLNALTDAVCAIGLKLNPEKCFYMHTGIEPR